MENWSQTQRDDFKDLSTVMVKMEESFQKCALVLSTEIEKNSKRGTSTKIILITLGALVATKGIIDQLMIGYKPNTIANQIVLIIFTLIGLIISIVASLETAFKYAEKAAGLRILSAQVQTNIRKGEVNKAISYHNAEFKEAMDGLKKGIIEQNDKLSEIYDKAASFGIDLASKQISLEIHNH